jgi:outer membrane cobalamin receptor
VITPAQLAQAAYGLLQLPMPKPSHYPNGILKENGHPYTLVNATLRYRVNDALTFQGRLENLFDEDYALADGYRTEGRSYTVGVRYSFE